MFPSLPHFLSGSSKVRIANVVLCACLSVWVALLAGCGAGGYAGGGIESLSSSTATIDAGQTIPLSAVVTGTPQVSWALSGGSCPSVGCGTLSSTTGIAISYTAPAGTTAPFTTTLTAAVAGTKNSSVATITVNPDPTISGVPPAGTVGTSYTTTLTATGGTGTLTWALAAGSLPAGISFNTSTGVISGTPTTAGSSTFTVKSTDQSSLPFSVTAQETIVITAASVTPLAIAGNPPSGTVGTAYSTALSGSGGTAPYTYSLTQGSLPAGLTLSAATGVIAGTPTTAGSSVFGVQVKDATGTTATAAFSITVNNAASTLSLTLPTLPGGTVGVPYTATIGVTGGTAPYSCAEIAGSLPAGLALTGCVVSGTPTAAGTSVMTVKATDSSSPVQTVSGPESITITAAVTLTFTPPPPATVNTPYTGTIGVSGGTGPYSCALVSGTLPAGLTLGSNCVITGTPTTPGSSTITVKGTDSSNPANSTTGPVTVTVNTAALALTMTTLPNGTVGVPYSSLIGVSGGTAPYACAVTAGSLPAGLTINGCTVSGTPTTAGTATVTVKATDSSSPMQTVSGPETITIAPASLSLTLSTLPAGTVGTPYSATIGVAGGTAPYSCAITAGTLQAGLALTGCTVSGTPTVAGTANLTVKATDSSTTVETTTGPVSLTIAPAALKLTLTSLPSGTVGVAYTATIGVSGGTAPYSCAISGGTLPAGLTLSGCVVSGNPTTAGTSNVTVTATDSGNPVLTTTGPETITINPAATTLTLSSPPAATVGVAYAGTIGVNNGTAPYACSLVSGTLPAGLTLGAGCVVTGTPTTPGTSMIQVKATDSTNPTAKTVTGPVTLTVNPAALTLTLSTLPNGTVGVAYTATIGVSGGTSPYACAVTSGTLPAGLSITGCTVSGTPTTAGASTVTVKVIDSSNPIETTSGPETITIAPAALSLSLTSLPSGTVGTPYTGTIGVSGGTAPYSCTITAGTLQAGLTLNGCVVSGTPTAAGTANLTVKATDSSTTQETTTGPVSLTINPAALKLTLSTLPNGTVGVAYSSVIGVSGGTAPYSCAITSGTLPAGLALSGCTVSGTPTTAGTSNVTVKATDSSPTVETVSGPESITIVPAALTLTLSSLPNGTVGTPYSAVIGVSGGTAPYSCAITAGTLQAGLTLTGCTVSGTPTVASTVNLTVKATDSSTTVETTTGPVSLTINPAALTLTLSSLPNGTVGTPYSAVIGVSGGTAPYSCVFTSGTLPAGLTLTGCTVSGTPTVAVTANLTVKATDAGNPQQTKSGPESLTIVAAPVTLTLTSPPNGTVGTVYTGSVGVSGGTGPYTCSLVSGTLPAGLTLGTSCAITGTPTTAGSSTFSVKAVDSSSPVNTNTGSVTMTIAPPTVTLTLSAPANGTVGVAYTGLVGVSGGKAPYSCALVSGALPAGLTLSASCAVTGTPTTAETSAFVVKATDSTTPTAATTTSNLSMTIAAVSKLTLTGTLPNATVGVAYTQTLTATGGIAPYTYAVTAGSLPAGLTMASDGVISGTPTAAGASSFTVTATDTEGTPQTASLPLVLLVVYPTTPNDGELKGPYAFLFQGYDDELLGVLSYQTATVGSFTADGTGVIGSGEEDANHQGTVVTGTTVPTVSFLGTYTIGTDSRGTVTVTQLNADGTTGLTTSYAIALKAPVSPATVATSGSLIEADDNNLAGTKGTGTLLAQTTSSFATGLSGSHVFGMQGDTPCFPACTVNLDSGPVAAVGQFTANSGAISSGTGDSNIANGNYASKALSGTYQAADGNGRIQLSMSTAGTPAGFYPTDYAVYVVNGTQAFVMSTDPHASYALLAGSMQTQTQTNFTSATGLTGPFIGYENAAPNPGLVGATLQDLLSLSTATIFRATSTTPGTCDFTNVDVAGLTGLVNTLTGLGSGVPLLNDLLGTYQSLGNASCPVTSNGRTVLNYPPPTGLIATVLGLVGLDAPPPARILYLSSADKGYFLESGYAGLGNIEPQTGGPFSEANTFTGTYVYSTEPSASVASIDTSGVFVSNGNGTGTTIEDLNIGVGTINLIQLGVSGSSTYTAPDPTTGRFLINGTVAAYAITPNRFVLVDTNILATSPTVSLLY